MSYYGFRYPFNTNGGALLSKRNYINRKIDEIEKKLLDLGWIESTEEQLDEYDIPVESAGAILPYRDKINKKLDFFEEVISSHLGNISDLRGEDYRASDYEDRYPSRQNNVINKPVTQYTPQQEVREQEVSKNFNEAFSNIFG
jgi:hypothetical protein